MEYLARAVDAALAELLQSMGAVLIEGPRGCGKTSTALEQAASSLRLDRSPELVALASLDPSQLLQGAAPRLLDEWQLAPSLWNAVRHEVDDRQARGQFILSGSAAPPDDVTRHSGGGRVGRLRMRPMALAETGASSQELSLVDLIGSARVSGVSSLTYRDLAEHAVRGGWPGLLAATTRQAMLFNRSYLDALCSTDIPEATGVRHDVARIRRLLESISRNISSEVTLRRLATDVAGDGRPVDPKTIGIYLDSLSRVFAVEELPAWSASLRSKSRLRTIPKIHLADPALACAALGIGPDRLARDPEYFGQVFESLAIRDLSCLVDAHFGRIYHYRDNTGLEVDAILEFPDAGRWAACEIKLGASRIPDAERNLLKLRDERVDLDRVGEPAFLAIITGTEYAYTLPSGVHVVPLATLRADFRS